MVSARVVQTAGPWIFMKGASLTSRGADQRLGPELRITDGFHLDPHSAQAEQGVGDLPAAALPVSGDLAVFHLDPGAQVVGEPGALRADHQVEVAQLVGRRIVVVRHPELERELGRTGDGRGRDPRDAGH
jgi:hypothetical protein